MGTGAQMAEYARGAFDCGGGYIFGTQGVTWTAAKQAQMEKNRADNPNYTESIKYGKKWIGHRVWDCSGLTKKAAEQAGVSIHHGSNSTYLSDCAEKGELAADMDLPIGAFVFVHKNGKKSHIGIVTAEGEVTEASCARLGVIHSKVHDKKWTYWGLCKGVEFDFSPGPAPSPEPGPEPVKHKTLRRGDKGPEVKEMQQLLLDHGEALPRYGVDGDFGRETEAAVKNFQMSQGIKVDGICGPVTWSRLEA